jgi:hypothetical protein
MGIFLPPLQQVETKVEGWPGSSELTAYAKKYGELRNGRRVLDFTQKTYLPQFDCCVVIDLEGITPYGKLLYSQMWILGMLTHGLSYSVPEKE